MSRTDAPATPPAADWASTAGLLRARQRQWRVAVAGLCALVLAGAAWIAWTDRREVERLALAQAELHARVIEGQVTRAISSSSSVVRALSESPALRELGQVPGAASAQLREPLAGQPLLRSLSLVDDGGRVINSSDPGDLGRRIDLARLGQPRGAQNQWLGPPLPARDLGELADVGNLGNAAGRAPVSLPLVQRMVMTSGATLTLVALVNADYFATQHDLIVADTALRPIVADFEGRLFSVGREVGLPSTASLKHLPLFKAWLPLREHGSYIGEGSEHDRAVTAFRASRSWPLVVVLELPPSALQQQWSSLATKTAAGTTGLCLLFLGFGLVAERGFRREREAQAQMARLHDELEHKEERWQLALDGAGQGVWDWHIGPGRIEVSARLLKMLGYAEADVSWTFDQWREHIHPDDLPGVMLNLKDHLAGRLPKHSVELRLKEFGGGWRWVHSRARLTRERTAEGNPVRLTGTCTDITERRQTVIALRDSEAQLRATFEQAAVGMLQQARDRSVLRVNPALCDMLGRSSETLVGTSFSQYIHPGDVAEGQLAMAQLYEGKLATYSQEKRYLHHDGHWVWVRLTASVARDAKGDALYMICVMENIEAQRRVEQERNALNKRFEEAANALRRQRRALDEHAIVSIADADGRIVYVNSKLTSMSGFTFEDLVGRQHSLLASVHADQPLEARPQLWTAEGARAITGEVRQCVQEGRIWEGELLHHRKDGTPFWAASTVVPMVGDDGALQEILVIQTDITQRVQAEQRVQEARRAELAIGARIQKSLLVEPLDQRLPGLWLSTFSQASQGVDGDFIEIIPLGEHTVDVIAGDVMGKGVGAALMGAGTKMQFSRSIADLMARPDSEGLLPSPAEIVGAVHRAMTPNLQSLDAFVTLNYVRIDDRAGTVTWVGCGHEEPLLVRADGSTATLANQHPPLGVLDDEAYTQHTLPIARDDALFLCSDGAVDALLPDGERVGKAHLHAALQRLLSRQRAPAAVLHALRAELQGLGARFTDDLTMALAVRTRAAALDSRRELPATLKSIADVRGLVEARSRQAGLAEEAASLFAVACVEGFTNAVRHGRGRPADAPVELLVSTRPDALVVELVHLGQAFQPPENDAPTVFDEYPEGGFGLQIMRSATDRVEHLHHHGINTLRLTRWLSHDDPA